MKELAMFVAWPSFLMAGVIEMLVFALFDPQDIHWFGGPSVEMSSGAIYSLGFFCFWLITSLAASLSIYLARPQIEAGRRSAARLI